MAEKSAKKTTAVLLVTCPDRKGLVAGIADFVSRHGANILHTDEHTDPDSNRFLMRIEWDLADFKLDMHEFSQHFSPLADKFQMDWRVALASDRPRVAIFVSRLDHCLADLLYRRQTGELSCEIPLVISNHADAKRLADFYQVPFHHIPIAAECKQTSEQAQLKLLRESRIDLIVLARYMQILSNGFIQQFPSRIINIHHSFLPAFIGAKPYHRSFERGVKLVGATSHYVTEVLDEGPIIEQDIIRVTHRDTLDGLVQKGRDLEKVVLSRAVRWHVENRILLYGNKTAVFE
ncbi:MAG TPA: formyltetrahydrofolate deformylase [Terriglobales bacterium]|nr:formyltetrahydrofolate deformylase [Terriglobales bacterium]